MTKERSERIGVVVVIVVKSSSSRTGSSIVGGVVGRHLKGRPEGNPKNNPDISFQSRLWKSPLERMSLRRRRSLRQRKAKNPNTYVTCYCLLTFWKKWKIVGTLKHFFLYWEETQIEKL